jgi:hypothetical protein
MNSSPSVDQLSDALRVVADLVNGPVQQVLERTGHRPRVLRCRENHGVSRVDQSAQVGHRRGQGISQTPRHRLDIPASGTTAIASISICQAGSANDATCAIVSAG